MMRYFIRSLGFALSGIVQFFRRERNGQIQGIIALLVIGAGFFFGVTKTEWLALLGCSALVISLEMLNSAIEKVCNMYTTEFHPAIKVIKDVAAASVLWSALFSLAIGLIIFIPHLLRLI
jgi:diacylglycerol kinase